MFPLSFLVSVSILASSGQIVNFDGDAIGRMPPGWTAAVTNRGGAPRWEVRRDETAPTQPYVLAQLSNEEAHDRCPLAIFEGVNPRDVDVSVRIKPVAGREFRAGGLVWRYRDPDNYYLARENVLTHNVAMYRVENGRRIQIGKLVAHDLEPNVWNILKVSVRGARFQLYVNHHRVLTAEDHSFAGPGKVGLWTAADSVTYFDDFRVYPK
jgi:hypothetical protein